MHKFQQGIKLCLLQNGNDGLDSDYITSKKYGGIYSIT